MFARRLRPGLRGQCNRRLAAAAEPRAIAAAAALAEAAAAFTREESALATITAVAAKASAVATFAGAEAPAAIGGTLSAAAAEPRKSGALAAATDTAVALSPAFTAEAPTAAVPVPTGREFLVHQHVLRLLLRWVLRKVHVLRGPTG